MDEKIFNKITKQNIDKLYEELFNPNMIKFVEHYYDSFDYNEMIRKHWNYNEKNNIPHHPDIDIHIPNIKKFLNTKITWRNNSIYSDITDFKVSDLPKDMLKTLLECLGYVIGVTSHTGTSLYHVYVKYLA